MYVIYVSNPMSPEYDEDVYCENVKAVNAYLGRHFETDLSESAFVYDDLTDTFILRQPINGFNLRVNRRPLWKVKS